MRIGATLGLPLLLQMFADTNVPEVQAWFEDLLAGSVKSISFERANEDGEEPGGFQPPTHP